MRDRRLLAIVGAGAVAVITIVVIVLVAIQPVPDFAALEGSRQTGYVAYFADAGRDSRDVRVVDLSTGESTDVAIGPDSEIVGWDDHGNLVLVEWGPSAERYVVVDAATGDQIGTLSVEQGQRFWQQDHVWTEHEDGRIVMRGTSNDVLVTFPAPGSYDVQAAAEMGEDRVVFIDELGRVAVVDRGDDMTPIQVADDATSWGQVAGRP